jgi:hypothetical protein
MGVELVLELFTSVTDAARAIASELAGEMLTLSS